jgi:hypothetical protein
MGTAGGKAGIGGIGKLFFPFPSSLVSTTERVIMRTTAITARPTPT